MVNNRINKKVAILGKLGTKFRAPFEDESYDIWTLNRHADADQLSRITLWFDIHTRANEAADITKDNYPFDEVIELVGGKYFNNSISYMIAYAILKGYKEIELYGMRFEHDKKEREEEYHNVRELIFFAKGKGIKVSAPYDEVMLKEYKLYGAN